MLCLSGMATSLVESWEAVGRGDARRSDQDLLHLGGADAVDNAIKLARLYTGRQKVVTRYRSYHGATYGAISATGDPGASLLSLASRDRARV